MRVKKFEAKSMKEALQMVKNELGPDAVILAAKDNRKFGIKGEASVEVTAAVSESTLQKKKFTESRLTTDDRARFSNSNARTQRTIIDKMVDNRERQNREDENAERQATDRQNRRITPVSYIDIPDEDEMPRARRAPKPISRAEMERAVLARIEAEREQTRLMGEQIRARKSAIEKRVPASRELETDFDHEDDDAWSVRSTREVLPQASKVKRSPQGERPEEGEPTAQAKARIRAAAKEAFKNSFFDDEKRAERDARGTSQAAASAASPMQPAPTPNPTISIDGKAIEIETLKGEITRLQQALDGFQKVPQNFTSLHPGADFGVPYDFSFMFQKLTESGVTIEHTVEILQAAQKEIDQVQSKKKPIIDAWVARFFLSQTQVNPTPFQGRIHLFTGGAGSGKTSTLVKMASHLVVREKKRVAILTTDSFKVGAVDQLKIYCQILNVPFAVIRNRKDWEWVLNQLAPMDHILVDFPGLQLRDLEEIHMLKSLLPPEEVVQQTRGSTHFCVSATTKDGDAFEIARRYRVVDYNDLIITNLDQSVQHGLIYNVQRKTGKSLHSFGIGNRIPEDFELASKERVLDLIFKLTKFKKETR